MMTDEERRSKLIDFCESLDEDFISDVRRASEGQDFWCGLDSEILHEQFQELKEEHFRQIAPVWDMRHQALSHCDIQDKLKNSYKLHIALTSAFLLHSRHSDLYTPSSFKSHSSHKRLLRVLGHWMRGDSLSPPLFALLDGKLIKQDGHHRVTVAVLSGTPYIPFYCQASLKMEGIIECPDDWKYQANWRPDSATSAVFR